MPTLQNVLGFIFEITILAAMITISYILKPKLTATIGLLAITILFVAAATRLQHGLATKIRECIPMDGLGGVKSHIDSDGCSDHIKDCSNKYTTCNYQLL